jgi:hypothetical protein
MVQPGIGKQQNKRKQLARNQKGRIVGTKKRLVTFHSSTGILQKQHFHAGFLFGLFYDSDDGGDMFL